MVHNEIYHVPTVGHAVSYIIVSLIVAVLRFHAVSLYCTYTVFVPSHALHHDHVTIFQLLLVQYVSATLYVLLSHENLICVTVFVSAPFNVNVVAELFVYVAAEFIEIVHVGNVVSNIVLIVFDTLLLFNAASVATHAAT